MTYLPWTGRALLFLSLLGCGACQRVVDLADRLAEDRSSSDFQATDVESIEFVAGRLRASRRELAELKMLVEQELSSLLAARRLLDARPVGGRDAAFSSSFPLHELQEIVRAADEAVARINARMVTTQSELAPGPVTRGRLVRLDELWTANQSLLTHERLAYEARRGRTAAFQALVGTAERAAPRSSTRTTAIPVPVDAEEDACDEAIRRLLGSPTGSRPGQNRKERPFRQSDE